MFREKISKDTYIYLEELTKLTGFELHPMQTIDIERPSSASKDHEVRWRLPLIMMVSGNDWVTGRTILEPKEVSVEGQTKFKLDPK